MNIFQVIRMNQKQHGYDQLTEGLTEFGLRPKDWSLIESGPSSIRIQNKTEPSFCFQGLYSDTQGDFKWNRIQLVSL